MAWGLSIKSTQGVGIYEAGKVFPKNNTRKLLQVCSTPVPNCDLLLLRKMSARDVFRSAGRILVKLDSSIVTRSNGTGLALGRTANIVEQGKF